MGAASGTNELAGNLTRSRRLDLIKTAAVYGHNASGKTNLLDVFYALGLIVIGSGRGDIPARVPAIEPFRLDHNLQNKPSQFEIELVLGADRYRYTLHATSERVIYEKLEHAREDASRQAWSNLLERFDPQSAIEPSLSTKFGTHTQRAVVSETTVPERSMLGHGAAVDIAHARKVFDWFDNQLFFYALHRVYQRQEALLDELADRLVKDDSFKRRYLRFVTDADFGVVGANVSQISGEQLKLFEKATMALREVFAKIDYEIADETIPQPPLTGGLRLMHRNFPDDVSTELSLARESSGTRRFMALLYILMRHGEDDQPGTVVIDELDSSLSPELVQRLIRLAHDPEVNRAGTQVIFTTHDRSLLDEPNLLRRDQVWITQKGQDGSTEVYSLAEFGSEVRPNRPVGRQFTAGRFGGVADFGPALEAIPVRTVPQELPLFEDRDG